MTPWVPLSMLASQLEPKSADFRGPIDFDGLVWFWNLPNIMSALNWPSKSTPKRPLKCWNPSSGSKVTILASLEVMEAQQSMDSTQYYVSIELALKNYPKKTPQMLKSVQWFKSYIFGLFRGHTASKKWKIKFRRTVYGQGDGAWQFSGISGQGELMSRNSDFAPIVSHWSCLICGPTLLETLAKTKDIGMRKRQG